MQQQWEKQQDYSVNMRDIMSLNILGNNREDSLDSHHAQNRKRYNVSNNNHNVSKMYFAPLDQVNEFSADNNRQQANATTSNAGFINHID